MKLPLRLLFLFFTPFTKFALVSHSLPLLSARLNSLLVDLDWLLVGSPTCGTLALEVRVLLDFLVAPKANLELAFTRKEGEVGVVEVVGAQWTRVIIIHCLCDL